MLRNWGSSIRGAACASVLVLCACGGGQKPAQSPGGEDTDDGMGKANEPAAPRVLEPASEPSGVVAKFRIKSMAALADGVMEAASIPVNWRELLEKDKETSIWSDAIDWDGSVEAVAAMNVKRPQKPHGAFSVGVKGIGAVLSLLEQKDVGALEGPGDVFYFEVSRENCAVGPALGSSAARVVCSDSRDSLDLLLPYALRGLPGEKLSPADVHLQFEMQPFRAAYGKEVKTFLRFAPAAARSQHQGNRTFDSALSDGAVELAREGSALVDELDRITLQLEQKSGDFTGSVEVELKGESSDVVGILKDFDERQKTVPEIFDKIPSTASSAGYSREISAEYATKWMSIIADLLQGGAEMEGVSAPFAKKLGAVIRALGPRGETGVYARGPLVESKVGDKTKLHSAWVLSGTTRKKDDIVQLLDDIGWLIASSDMKMLYPESPELPSIKRKFVKIATAPTATVFEWKMSPELMRLASIAGAQMRSEVEMGDALANLDEFESGLIAVAEYDGATWISWGKNKEEIAESFGALTKKDSERLGSLGGLGGVRSEPAVSAGFARLDALVGMTSFLFSETVLGDFGGMKKVMPHRGNVPVVYSFRVKKGTTTKATWRVHVPVEFTQDLAALGISLAAEKGAALKKSN